MFGKKKEKTWGDMFSTDVSSSSIQLEDGDRVAVIGGGPEGSFTAYFLKDMSVMIGLDIEVDIYEPNDFTRFGAAGCNHQNRGGGSRDSGAASEWPVYVEGFQRTGCAGTALAR